MSKLRGIVIRQSLETPSALTVFKVREFPCTRSTPGHKARQCRIEYCVAVTGGGVRAMLARSPDRLVPTSTFRLLETCCSSWLDRVGRDHRVVQGLRLIWRWVLLSRSDR